MMIGKCANDENTWGDRKVDGRKY